MVDFALLLLLSEDEGEIEKRCHRYISSPGGMAGCSIIANVQATHTHSPPSCSNR